MLRITIELVPYGDESAKKTIGTMVIANEALKDSPLSSYQAWVSANDWTKEPEMFGRLEEFDRNQSVWELVKQMLYCIRNEKHEPETSEDSLSQRLKKRLDPNWRKG